MDPEGVDASLDLRPWLVIWHNNPSHVILRNNKRSLSHCLANNCRGFWPSIFWGDRHRSTVAKSRTQYNQSRMTPASEKPSRSFTFPSMPLALLSVFIVFPMPRWLVTPALTLRSSSEVVHYKETPQIFIDAPAKTISGCFTKPSIQFDPSKTSAEVWETFCWYGFFPVFYTLLLIVRIFWDWTRSLEKFSQNGCVIRWDINILKCDMVLPERY